MPFYDKKIMNKIRIGVFSYYLRNGGRARITSLLLNYLYRINIFNLYLFTTDLGFEKESEYYIESNIIRTNMKNYTITNLIKEVRKKKIDILIYQYSNSKSIKMLSNLYTI